MDYLNLTRYEKGMTAEYIFLTNIRLHGGTYTRTGTAKNYTLINDLTRIVKSLPYTPSYDEFAVLRYYKQDVPVDHRYRPRVVAEALVWLQNNNRIRIHNPSILDMPTIVTMRNEDSNTYRDGLTIDVSDTEGNVINAIFQKENGNEWSNDTDDSDTDEETDDKEKDNNNLENDIANAKKWKPSTQTHSKVIEEELLATPNNPEIVNHLQELKEMLQREPITTGRTAAMNTINTPALIREKPKHTDWINVYTHPQEYWEKAFPWNYPYGYGGPSDPHFILDTLEEYHDHILQRGAGLQGRRFQEDYLSIFATYSYNMHRKVGNASYAASRNLRTRSVTLHDSSLLNLANLQINEETKHAEEFNEDEEIKNQKETETIVTKSDIEMVLKYLTEIDTKKDIHVKNALQQRLGINVVEPHVTEERIKQLAQRLIPFSRNLPGTSLYFNYQKLNFTAMAQSPLILAKARWRYFLTFAYPDLYISRLYEMILKSDDSQTDEQLEAIVKDLPLDDRKYLSSRNPALVLRLFCAKQNAIWKYIIMGQNKPYGDVTDFVTKKEVSKHY